MEEVGDLQHRAEPEGDGQHGKLLQRIGMAQLGDRVEGWGFERRQGSIAEELLATGKDIGAAHPDATVVIVVGSSSLAAHRVVGSVAVALARHSPVPLIVVP